MGSIIIPIPYKTTICKEEKKSKKKLKKVKKKKIFSLKKIQKAKSFFSKEKTLIFHL